MYPISNAVKALFESEQRQILRITGIDKNGTAINITDADVVIDSFNIDRYSCNGEKLEIGTAIAAEMTLKLDNHDGRFNGIVFEGTELFVRIGIADWAQDNPTIHWIPCGYFTPDEQPRKLTTISLKALDRMVRFDAVPPVLTPWTTASGETMTDSQGNILYFVSGVAFPCTVAQLVKRAAILCNVPFTQDISALPNANYTISALPTLQQDITFRNIIQWCAGIIGTNAFIDWNGELRFQWYAEVDYTSTMAKRYSSDLHENDIVITGVQYTNTQNVSIVSGASDYAIDMTGNYLAATGIAEILPNVKDVVEGFNYRPFEASVISAPWLWPMDVITFTDKDGNDHTCAVTNVNFGLNGTTALAGKGETAQANKGTAPSAVTNEQAFLIERVTETAAEKAAENMTQEQIFNALTNNGEIQGLLLYDGKVYLNASYINTGFLSADRISANSIGVGKLTGSISGGLNNSWVLDLDNGTMTIGNISANNITTGTLSADRISANSIGVGKLTGSISATATGGTTAWSIDLKNGTLTIGDINASSIKAGTMSADRISGGTINGNNISVTNLNASNITGGILNCDNITVTNLKATSISGPNTNPVTGTFTTYRYYEQGGLEIEMTATMTIVNGIITGLTGYT